MQRQVWVLETGDVRQRQQQPQRPVMMDRRPRTAETRAAAESTAAEEGPAAGPYVPPEGERRTAVPTTALEEVPAAAERWRLVEGLVLQQKL